MILLHLRETKNEKYLVVQNGLGEEVLPKPFPVER